MVGLQLELSLAVVGDNPAFKHGSRVNLDGG